MNIETREAGSRRNRRTGLIEEKKREARKQKAHTSMTSKEEKQGNRRNRSPG